MVRKVLNWRKTSEGIDFVPLCIDDDNVVFFVSGQRRDHSKYCVWTFFQAESVCGSEGGGCGDGGNSN